MKVQFKKSFEDGIRKIKQLIIYLFYFTLIVNSNFVFAFAENSKIEKVKVRPVEPFYSGLVTSGKEYVPSVTFVSDLKKAPIKFTSLGARWKQSVPPGTQVILEVQFGFDENKKSDWYVIEQETDAKNGEVLNLSEPSGFLATNLAEFYKYRVTLKTENSLVTPVFEDLRLTFINGEQSEAIKLEALTNGYQAFSEDEIEEKRKKYLQANVMEVGVKRKADVNWDNTVGMGFLKNSSQNNNDLNKTNNQNKEENIKFGGEQPSFDRSVLRVRRRVNTQTSELGNLRIISRAEWGADESLRIWKEDAVQAKLVVHDPDYYQKFSEELKITKKITTNSDGLKLTWPLEYPEKVSKIVIHHTATTKNLDDPKRAIRDIYYWHTVTKGWGDIGYNYIIDPLGNIYEGRFGGDGVVGSHAGKGNVGSIGIAILGNYQDSEVPEPVLKSLVKLLKQKTSQYNIDPEGNSLFRGENFNNIMGHKDIMATSCPGDRLYALLPSIRRLVKANFKPAVSINNSTLNTVNYSFREDPVLNVMNTKSVKKITLGIVNNGKETWGEDWYFKIRENDVARNLLVKIQGEYGKKVLGYKVIEGGNLILEMQIRSGVVAGSGDLEIELFDSKGNGMGKILKVPIQILTPVEIKDYDYLVESLTWSIVDYKPGDEIELIIKLKNTGKKTWFRDGVNKIMIGSDVPRDHFNTLLKNPGSRWAGMEEEVVANGQIGTFKVKLLVPRGGRYKEFFTPVIEGVTWMNNKNTFIEIDLEKEARTKIPTQGGARTNSFVQSNSGELEISAEIKNNRPSGSNKNIADSKLDLKLKPRRIRIDLAYRGNPLISADGQFELRDGANLIAAFEANEKIEVTMLNGKYFVENPKIGKREIGLPRFVPLNSTIMRIDNWERRNSWGNKDNNNEFRGVLEVRIYNGELHVINELELEDYIKGIAEESGSEPYEKIKAIKILSRSYARFYMEVATKFPGAPFDLNDDPDYSQKYLGYSFEKRSPVTVKAAMDTNGMVVTYEGKLIKTPYFTQSNGRTISGKDKWGWDDTPFLQSVDDSFCGTTEFKGHGVGLSGCGSRELAKKGMKFDEIIKYYFKGVEITKINS